MIHLAGQTRTRISARHALITPDGHVASVLAGVQNARVVAHITPAMGAKFSQYTYFLEATGQTVIQSGGDEYFLYLQHGSASITVDKIRHILSPGSYVYLPPQASAEIHATDVAATLVVFQKKYVSLSHTGGVPGFLIGQAQAIVGQPFLGNPRALLQVLLPDLPSFDLAVNIFTYQPGATLPFVETHVMEHGLLMLSGQGIYRLEDSWYPVTAGDVIWMAPFCPQWFVAMGDEPASYLYYKDVNRPLLNTP